MSFVYGRQRIPIHRFEEVKVAMHVMWWKGIEGIGYYHHAIVVNVDTVRRNVTVVHLTGNSDTLLQSSSSSTATGIVTNRLMI